MFRIQAIADRSFWVSGNVWWSMWSRDKSRARSFRSFEEAAEIAHRECSVDPHDYAIVSEDEPPVVTREAEVRVSE